MEDPHTYDLSEFAVEFVWALLFWNAAEQAVKQVVAHLIGGSSASSIAVAMDMGNRATLHALETAMREIEDPETRAIIKHLIEGFGRLLGYRNLYVHSLIGVGVGEPDERNIRKLHGHLARIKGEGRLRAVTSSLPTKSISEFKEHCRALSRYSQAIMDDLVGGDSWDLSELLDIEPPSLDKPNWPPPLNNSPAYLQE